MQILVTGGSGLVGKALKYIYDIDNIYFTNSKEHDLRCLLSTESLFNKIKPTVVIHLAANVGGLYKNINEQLSIFEDNILINTNVLKCAYKYGVKKCISCLSTCIFPNEIEYPINEKKLHHGPPHESNFAYSYSKRMLEVHNSIYKDIHKLDYYCIIPTNIYGFNDNFNLETGHVIPSLIHQCYLSKLNDRPFIVKGTGKPLRQFLYVNDLASIVKWLLDNYESNDNLIIAPPEEYSIQYISELIAKNMDFQGEIIYDDSYSDGQYKKTVDTTKLKEVYDYKFTSIENGIRETVNWFIINYDNIRK